MAVPVIPEEETAYLSWDQHGCSLTALPLPLPPQTQLVTCPGGPSTCPPTWQHRKNDQEGEEGPGVWRSGFIPKIKKNDRFQRPSE